jgi:hypothetical protein
VHLFSILSVVEPNKKLSQWLYYSFYVGGWMDGSHSDTRMVDLEVEEAEDVSGDPSIGLDSPTLLRASSKSQTKT